MSGERRTVRRERAAAAIDQHRQTPLRLDRMHVRICVRFSEGLIRFAQRRLASGRRAVRKIDFGERCIRIRDNRCVDARELDLPGFAPVQRRRIRSRVVPPPRASAERDQDRDDGSDAHGRPLVTSSPRCCAGANRATVRAGRPTERPSLNRVRLDFWETRSPRECCLLRTPA